MPSKNLKKLLNHTKNLQNELKILHQKNFVDQPQTSNLQTLKNSKKTTSTILLKAGLAVFLTCKTI